MGIRGMEIPLSNDGRELQGKRSPINTVGDDKKERMPAVK
jgi:hypothetical protein